MRLVVAAQVVVDLEEADRIVVDVEGRTVVGVVASFAFERPVLVVVEELAGARCWQSILCSPLL